MAPEPLGLLTVEIGGIRIGDLVLLSFLLDLARSLGQTRLAHSAPWRGQRPPLPDRATVTAECTHRMRGGVEVPDTLIHIELVEMIPRTGAVHALLPNPRVI
jgi:hypothetical protein